MNFKRLALSLVLTSTTLAGCSQDIQFSDSIDLDFDLLRTRDSLHSPYVAGAEFSICADSARPQQLAGMTLRASDSAILQVGPTDTVTDDADQICAEVTALAAGEVIIEVVDDGEAVASSALEVRAPDRAELFAAAPMLAERPDLDPRVDQPTILEGGTATFQVQYFDGQTRLHGNQALRVESTDELEVEVINTVLLEDREWLSLTPVEAGTFTLDLATSAGTFHTLTVDVVDEAAIADVAIHGSNEQGRAVGDPLVAFAQAYDEDDGFIFGVDYEWSLDDEAEPGSGDLFRYEFDPSRREELNARHGDLDAEVMIRAGEGQVDSSNDVGCSMGGRSGGAWALLLLGAMGLGRRSRRSSHRP